MGIGRKYDYPPLLAPGRHRMTLDQIEALFVKPFPGNKRRVWLFQLFERFLQDVLALGIPCELWLDGSLLTEKDDPGDLDVSVIVDNDVVSALSPDEYSALRALTDQGSHGGVDSFLLVRYPRHDSRFGDEHLDPAYSWGEQYGREHSEQWLKGFVVMRLRETNVGLRICS